MPSVDVYGRTHQLDPKSLEIIATRLEARRNSERYMRMLHEYLDLLSGLEAMSEPQERRSASR